MKTIVTMRIYELARLINQLQSGEAICFAEDGETAGDGTAWHTAQRARIPGITSREGILIYYCTTSTQRALMSIVDITAEELAQYMTDNNTLGGDFDESTPLYVEAYVGKQII